MDTRAPARQSASARAAPFARIEHSPKHTLLPLAFAVFEWGVRTGRQRRPGAALVFLLLTALGAAPLLTHSHAIGNVREQLLIEITHTPLALAGIGAGWARWLELRLDDRAARTAGWVWPVCIMIVGLVLLNYREA